MNTTIDDLLIIRGQIFELMADAKAVKANGKYFAYKQSYNLLSSVIAPINENLPPEQKKII